MADPIVTDPEKYRLLWENDRVRVLEYRDSPADQTHPHDHPDSVMITLSSFERSISSGDQEISVHLEAGQARWLGAQTHTGHNTGDTDTRAIFVELKEPRPNKVDVPTALGPSSS